jgi:hypothetical protein
MKGIKERQREGIKDEGMKEIIFCWISSGFSAGMMYM